MAPEYRRPGVFVAEVSTGSKPIEGAPTSIAAIVGRFPSGPLHKPVRATSEPNGEPLWVRVRSAVDLFLTSLFRQGAFQGSKPESGFFVQCARATTTATDIARDLLHVAVGLAPLKPAEFAVVKLVLRAGRPQA